MPSQTLYSPKEKMKKILLPTDFSPHAKAALKVGEVLGKKFEAKIDCLHIFDSIVDIKELSQKDAQRFPELEKKVKAHTKQFA